MDAIPAVGRLGGREAEAGRLRRWLGRLGYGIAAVIMTDLVVGFVVFSVLVLGIFCFFSLSWIGLASEAAARGIAFGSTYQLRLAMGVVVVAPAMALLVVYLGVKALALPRKAWRWARGISTFAPHVGLLTPSDARTDAAASRR